MVRDPLREVGQPHPQQLRLVERRGEPGEGGARGPGVVRVAREQVDQVPPARQAGAHADPCRDEQREGAVARALLHQLEGLGLVERDRWSSVVEALRDSGADG